MKNKNTIFTLIIILLLIVGLSLLFYPYVSNYWNERHQSRSISQYAADLAHLQAGDYQKMLAEAHRYNENLFKQANFQALSQAQKAEYLSLLDISGTGIMGYIEIPKIKCRLPIYHTAEESVLQNAAGHVEYSSLPVGGANTHAVISAHRGLPSAKLFTDLDRLEVGDIFEICVLKETLYYQVDQIVIVEPDDIDNLKIVEGKDYATLLTCTPYGINTHRLLVRGCRTETPITAESDITIEDTATKSHFSALLGIILGIVMIIVLWGMKKFSETRRR